MLIAPVKFPITDKAVVDAIRVTLTPTWSSGLLVQRKKPAGTTADPNTRRMVTVRNDSGPQDLLRSQRRYGINVWADVSVDAEKIALDAMAGLRTLRGDGIVLTDSFNGPFEIEDEPPLVVGGKPLYHFYFTCRVAVRGSHS